MRLENLTHVRRELGLPDDFKMVGERHSHSLGTPTSLALSLAWRFCSRDTVTRMTLILLRPCHSYDAVTLMALSFSVGCGSLSTHLILQKGTLSSRGGSLPFLDALEPAAHGPPAPPPLPDRGGGG